MKQQHWKGRSNISIYQMDCLEAMKEMEDNAFDLAIVDPPYGINVNMNMGVRKGEKRKHKSKGWDNETPSREYFKELKRVSKSQIIWGANNFIENLDSSSGWIYWDKKITGDVEFSSGELAYTSFNKSLKSITIAIQQVYLRETRIHPTQKPVKLYEWLLMNYAKEGDKILDTHLGSGSHAIACWNLNYDLTAFELDADYFTATTKRIEKHTRQIQMF
jgi:site-specific DNA-methyltransferase (adenine-specific)